MKPSIPFSQACERNKGIILETIKPYLEAIDSVLEIGSGSAQHSIYFAQALANLQWQTSDQLEYLDGINAALEDTREFGNELANLIEPFELDVNQAVWGDGVTKYQAIYSANTLHIMNESDVKKFFAGLSAVTQAGSYLIVYGPFKYDGKFTSESNADFDRTLRSREVGSAIRDFEFVCELATIQGFELVRDHAMPANNQCLVWQRKT